MMAINLTNGWPLWVIIVIAVGLTLVVMLDTK